VRAADLAAQAFGALQTQRRRTLLSLLGVSISVSAVVLLTALGEGARAFVQSQFEGLGSNIVVVLPGKVKTAGGMPGIGNTTSDLTISDAQVLRRAVPEALHVAPLCVGTEALSSGPRSRNAIVIGTTAEMLPIRGLEMGAGEFLPAGDWQRGANVIVLGATLARELFPGESALGALVRLGDWRLRVIGVTRPRGVHFGADLDAAAFVPVATAMRLFDRSSLFRVMLMLRSHESVEPVVARVQDLLRRRHGREDVTLITPDAVLGSLGSILTVLTLALSGIAAISLGVAGIGIMNVMLVAVSDRRTEIGLWKAIGAAPGQVMALFVTESALLSTAGGVLGVALGFALSALARALFPTFPASPPWWAAAIALATALLVGVLFGALPARHAVKLDPVVALAKK
jgi:putative ABC transport system permease protein